jgi:hypothetical protein
LVYGLTFGLALGLAFGLLAGLGSGQIDERDLHAPNEGIRRSLRYGLLFAGITGLGGGLAGGLVYGLADWLISEGSNIDAQILLSGVSTGLAFGIIIGLGGALAGGLGAFIQHWALRRQLRRAGALPSRYVRFLDFCADHILLQRVGGGYRFIHALLLEYFAALYAEGA